MSSSRKRIIFCVGAVPNVMDARRCWLVVAAAVAADSSSFYVDCYFCCCAFSEGVLPSFLPLFQPLSKKEEVYSSLKMLGRKNSEHADRCGNHNSSLSLSLSLLYIDPFAFFYDLVRNRPKITKVRSVYISLLPLPLLALFSFPSTHKRRSRK